MLNSHFDVETLDRVISASRATSEPAQPLTVRVYQSAEWRRVAGQWAKLARSSPYSSFYLSCEWVTAWLQVFGETLKPQILFFEHAGQTLGACLLTRGTEWRGPFRVSRIYLNTGGENINDRTLMEFNSILCREGSERGVAHALWNYLRRLLWDEFAIEGMCPDAVLAALQAEAFPTHTIAMNVRPTFYVDLDALRRSGQKYVDSLSANTRSQIRRSLKNYAAQGELKVEIAADVRRAETLFEEMCRLHQSRWTSRGESGAFAPGRRLEFHRTLIRQSYETNCIHLVRVSSGEETIGVLYNFVQNGKVYFFQSGFNYARHQNLRPGLVTHACVVQMYLEQGLNEYDFLAGAARYKLSLAKNSRYLAWISTARPSLKLSSIELLRLLKRTVQFGNKV